MSICSLHKMGFSVSLRHRGSVGVCVRGQSSENVYWGISEYSCVCTHACEGTHAHMDMGTLTPNKNTAVHV